MITEYDFEGTYKTYDEYKCCDIFFDVIHFIVREYECFLFDICEHIYYYPSSNVLGKDKFVEVRANLFEFLDMHKDLMRLKKIVYQVDDSKKKKKCSLFLFRQCF